MNIKSIFKTAITEAVVASVIKKVTAAPKNLEHINDNATIKAPSIRLTVLETEVAALKNMVSK